MLRPIQGPWTIIINPSHNDRPLYRLSRLAIAREPMETHLKLAIETLWMVDETNFLTGCLKQIQLLFTVWSNQ